MSHLQPNLMEELALIQMSFAQIPKTFNKHVIAEKDTNDLVANALI